MMEGDMMHSRRRILGLASGAAVSCLPGATQAQSYPSRPVRVIVPYPAGGPTDISARLLGQWLSERLGQTFIIDNRPGAGGNIGTEAALRSPPDGYTLLFAVSPNAINATLYERLSFNFIRDTAPVASVARTTLVMVLQHFRRIPSRSSLLMPEPIRAGSTTHPQGSERQIILRVNCSR
jgi:tripartite-type tricarboxylate transporter receptor subunit TctC